MTTYHPPVLKSPHWLPVKAPVEYKLLLTTYKAGKFISSAYFHSITQVCFGGSITEMKDKGLLAVPDFRLDKFGRSF